MHEIEGIEINLGGDTISFGLFVYTSYLSALILLNIHISSNVLMLNLF